MGPKVSPPLLQPAACTRLPSLSPPGTPLSPTSLVASPGAGRPLSPVSFHTMPKPAPFLQPPPQVIVPLSVIVLPTTTGSFIPDGLGESAIAPNADAATKTPPTATETTPASTRDPYRRMVTLPHARVSAARHSTLPVEGEGR